MTFDEWYKKTYGVDLREVIPHSPAFYQVEVSRIAWNAGWKEGFKACRTFDEWMKEVDSLFINRVGLSLDSWPDQDYLAMFDAGDTPMQALASAIENEYGEEGLEAFNLENI